MENASKALIIAGAILLSILIIGLGMMIFDQAKNALTGAGLSKQQISTYNSEFEAYIGTQPGTQVRSLCDLVRNHNSTNADDETRNIVVQTSNATGVTSAPTAPVQASEITNIKTGIKAGKTYTISFGYDKNSGLIVAVGIEEKK